MSRIKGFTLIELMIVLALMGVMLSYAVPAASTYMDKRRIVQATEAIYAEIQYARSEAIARSQTVYVKFAANDTTTWKMGVSTNAGCDLAKAATPTDVSDDCTLVVDDGDGTLDPGDGSVDSGDLVYRELDDSGFTNIKVGNGSGGNVTSFSFDPLRGTAATRTIVIQLGTKYVTRIKVGLIGRVRICSPTGTTNVTGYSTSACS